MMPIFVKIWRVLRFMRLAVARKHGSIVTAAVYFAMYGS